MILGTLSWKILTLLNQKAMYPLEIADNWECTNKKSTTTSENLNSQAP